jgi:Skp family chaperone for outer membrane proteins
MFPPRAVGRATTTAARILSTILLCDRVRIALYPQSIPQFCTFLNTLRSSFPLSSTFFPTPLLFFHLTQKWHPPDDSSRAKPAVGEVAWHQLETRRERISLRDGFAKFKLFDPRCNTMRFLPSCVFLLAASTAIPAICQSSFSANPTPAAITMAALPADASNPSVDYTALREDLSRQNKVLQDQLNVQRGILKKNQELLKEAQKLDADNKRLDAEKKKVEAQNADLEKQRQALKAGQKPLETASN